MLIAAIVGLDTRSTMDLDTTLRNLPLTEEKIMEALNEILKIDMKDEVVFVVKSITPIRKDDIYGGYSVRLDATYDTIVTPLSIDISTGDIITPEAVKYDKQIFKKAFQATAEHRGTLKQISDVEGILKQISESDNLRDMWRKYQKKFAYAKDVSYENILEVLRRLVL